MIKISKILQFLIFIKFIPVDFDMETKEAKFSLFFWRSFSSALLYFGSSLVCLAMQQFTLAIGEVYIHFKTTELVSFGIFTIILALPFQMLPLFLGSAVSRTDMVSVNKNIPWPTNSLSVLVAFVFFNFACCFLAIADYKDIDEEIFIKLINFFSQLSNVLPFSYLTISSLLITSMVAFINTVKLFGS